MAGGPDLDAGLTAQNDDTDALTFKIVQRVGDFLHHLFGQRIALSLVIHRDRTDTIADFDNDQRQAISRRAAAPWLKECQAYASAAQLAIDGFLIWRATLPLTLQRPMRRRK